MSFLIVLEYIFSLNIILKLKPIIMYNISND